MFRIYTFILLFFANINFATADIFNDIKNILADKSIPSCQNNRYSHKCSIKYNNGDKYVGGWDGSYLTGKGHYVWKSGEVYSGEWRRTKRHGKGINYYPNGDVARGQFADDTLTGFATYIWVNGDKATGNFKNLKLHGFATYIFASGEQQIGYYKNGKRDGKFQIVSSEGEDFIAWYENDILVKSNISSDKSKNSNQLSVSSNQCSNKEYYDNCFAKHKYENGDIYEGYWKKDKRSGQGKYIWTTGETYTGEFKNDSRYGQGVNIWPNKDKYSGEWLDDMKHGQGTFTYVSGEKYKGEWIKDKMHGHGTYYYANGSIYTGDNKNDLANGFGKFTKKSGFEYIGEFKDDKMHGKGKATFPDGTVKEGFFEDDMFKGEAVTDVAKRNKKYNDEDKKLIPISYGSAFFINSDGYAITNNHVIDGECQEIQGLTKEKKFIFKILATDQQNDIAILKTKNKKNDYFIRIEDQAKLGEDIIVGGFPISESIQNHNIKITKGIVSAKSGVKNNFSEIQIDASIQGGNSGGPVVNSEGKLVGVTTYSIVSTPDDVKSGNIITNMNFAKKSSLVKEMLSSYEVKYNEFALWERTPSNTIEVAKLLSNTTSQIYCLNTEQEWKKLLKKQK